MASRTDWQGRSPRASWIEPRPKPHPPPSSITASTISLRPRLSGRYMASPATATVLAAKSSRKPCRVHREHERMAVGVDDDAVAVAELHAADRVAGGVDRRPRVDDLRAREFAGHQAVESASLAFLDPLAPGDIRPTRYRLTSTNPAASAVMRSHVSVFGSGSFARRECRRIHDVG